MTRLKTTFEQKIRPELMKKFQYANVWQAPRLQKVVVNVGLHSGMLKDPKYEEVVEKTLQRITGQKPLKTKAKKSISNFKVRKGQIIGMKVTLRGTRMYDFIDKIINITLARIRDFRGLSPKSVDDNGNLNIGFKEHIAFPEIQSDEIEKIHGLQITVVTTARSYKEGYEFYKLLGFPFHT